MSRSREGEIGWIDRRGIETIEQRDPGLKQPTHLSQRDENIMEKTRTIQRMSCRQRACLPHRFTYPTTPPIFSFPMHWPALPPETVPPGAAAGSVAVVAVVVAYLPILETPAQAWGRRLAQTCEVANRYHKLISSCCRPSSSSYLDVWDRCDKI